MSTCGWKPATLDERVEVTSSALALDTASATVGHTITEKQVTELPLNGRNFLQLLFLGAGAVETTGEQAGMRQGVGNAISIMGARPTSNNYMLDGTANTDTSLGTPAAVLSIDAIQEFKEQTTTYSAEYGFSSNQINVISKTGTNAFHGTGFGFFRNEKLDARNFFDPPNAEKPQLDQKQFGFVQGGPVWLPFYDGRNKTFFLVNYEGTRIERGFSSFYTVPTPDQLAGRFTSAIIDPATGQAFANNTIPQTRFSRLAQLALRNGWYPAPNISAAQGNYQAIRTLPQEANQFTIRIDQDLAKTGARVRTLYQVAVRQPHQLESARYRRSRLRAGHDQLAGVPHLGLPQQHRQPVARGPCRGPGGPEGDRVPAGRCRFPSVHGHVHRPSGCPAGMSEHRHSGVRGHRWRGQRLQCQQPAHVGCEQPDDVDDRPSHAEFRRELPAMVAAARPRHRIPWQLRLQRRLHR